MTTTGIVRKIDELGRIVLPKELRKCLNINTGDDFQITVSDEKIILEKYSRLNSVQEEIIKIINCFSSVNNNKIYFVIKDENILDNSKVNNKILEIVLERKIYICDNVVKINILDNHIDEGKYIIFPIVIDSDLLGTVIIVNNIKINDMINTAKIINNIIKILLLNN